MHGLEVADDRRPLPVDEERGEQRRGRTSAGARGRRRAPGRGRGRPSGSRCRPSGCRSGRRRRGRRRRRRRRSAAASPPCGIARKTAIAISIAGWKLEKTNGSVPPSGKAKASITAVPSAAAASSSPRGCARRAPGRRRRRRGRAPATGLASGQRTAKAIASGRQPRCEANTAASAIATPSANAQPAAEEADRGARREPDHAEPGPVAPLAGRRSRRTGARRRPGRSRRPRAGRSASRGRGRGRCSRAVWWPPNQRLFQAESPSLSNSPERKTCAAWSALEGCRTR